MVSPDPNGLPPDIMQVILERVKEGDEEACLKIVMETLGSGIDPTVILEKGFVPAIQTVGDLFDEGELFLPELMMAGKAMKAAADRLGEALREAGGDQGSRTVVVLGTVKGDFHEIGKNIVGVMLEASGFDVKDLGMDISAEEFVVSAKEHGAKVIGASALLTTTMEHQRELVKLVKEELPSVKVIVGGAPVSDEWAREIGADGYGDNAKEAVDLVKEMVEGGGGE